MDVAWGGMFYVTADIRQFSWVVLEPDQGREITKILSLILRAAQDQLKVSHSDYPGVDITISQLFGPTDEPNADVKNAVTVASGDVDFDNPSTWIGALDRYSCGTETCARMITMYAKGELKLNEPFRHQSLL